MYQHIASALDGPLTGKILGISGIEKIGHLIKIDQTEITRADYPDVDMQCMPYYDDFYDVVVSDQVIEHLADPARAVSECGRVLRPGGLAIITSCFLNPLHPSPNDYWRFSPEGMQHLFNDEDWEIIEYGGWGNRIALILIFIRDRFRFMDIPEGVSLRRRLATWNEKKYPVVTWIVARKRGAAK
ncbi:MAG: methyltransferase domain-containing protein [Geobacteraceae bacterium]